MRNVLHLIKLSSCSVNEYSAFFIFYFFFEILGIDAWSLNYIPCVAEFDREILTGDSTEIAIALGVASHLCSV